MKYQAENTVSSFFYYMWNAWSEEECKTVYGGMYPPFWEKWCVATDKGTFGAAERFYLQLMRLRSNGSTGIPGLRNPVPARIAGGGRPERR